MSKKICIYCASSNNIDPVFFKAANELAALMAKKNHTLVYGGGCIGLMGELSKTIHHHGGKVIGIIPEKIKNMGFAYEAADELVITKDMRERKHLMEKYSDGFITLPGGFGTLEEISEMITGKQLQYHDKPLVFLNINNFYDPLFNFFDHIYNYGFSKQDFRELYYVTSDINDAVSYIESYTPIVVTKKW